MAWLLPPHDSNWNDRSAIYRLRSEAAEAARLVSHTTALIEETMVLLKIASKMEGALIGPNAADQVARAH